jgi:hypothetical protein
MSRSYHVALHVAPDKSQNTELTTIERWTYAPDEFLLIGSMAIAEGFPLPRKDDSVHYKDTWYLVHSVYFYLVPGNLIPNIRLNLRG